MTSISFFSQRPRGRRMDKATTRAVARILPHQQQWLLLVVVCCCPLAVPVGRQRREAARRMIRPPRSQRRTESYGASASPTSGTRIRAGSTTPALTSFSCAPNVGDLPAVMPLVGFSWCSTGATCCALSCRNENATESTRVCVRVRGHRTESQQ